MPDDQRKLLSCPEKAAYRLYGSVEGGGVLYRMFVTASSAEGALGLCKCGRPRDGRCILSEGYQLEFRGLQAAPDKSIQSIWNKVGCSALETTTRAVGIASL